MVQYEIENPDGFGLYTDAEIQSMHGFTTEKLIKTGSNERLLKQKWSNECPTSNVCDTKEEAAEIAKESIADRENWLTDKKNTIKLKKPWSNLRFFV